MHGHLLVKIAQQGLVYHWTLSPSLKIGPSKEGCDVPAGNDDSHP